MDEIHLHVAHGLSFRTECRELKDIFFKHVFHPRDKDQYKPRLICLTATMTTMLLPGLEYMMSVKFPPQCIHRGDVDDFLQLNIFMSQEVVSSGDYVRIGLSMIATHLDESDLTSKVVVFCNSKGAVTHYMNELERKFDEKDNDSECIGIHGGLDKNEKFWRIRLFTSLAMESMSPILVSGHSSAPMLPMWVLTMTTST